MLPSWTLGDAWLSSGAERLIAGSLQGAIAAAAVWLICRRITTIPSTMRALLWWLVSLKLVASLVPLPSLPVPLLPAARVDVAGEVIPGVSVPLSDDVAAPRVFVERVPRDTVSTVRMWMIAGMGVWLAGVLIHAVRLLWSLATLRRTLRQSTRVGADDAAIADRMARQLGLTITPDVRVAARVSTSFVAGLLRPTVLLPEHAISTLTPDERAMAICHELAHVRRRDLLLGWVPAIAERLFFFHPLARLAAREYAAEREAACDALVIKAMDVAPREYGRMLVRLGVSGLTPVFTASGSSPSRSVLRRRLDMLNDVTFTRSRRGAIVLIAAISVAAIVPFHLVAREAVFLADASAVEQQTAAPAVAAPVVAVPVVAAPVVAAPVVAAPAVAAPVQAKPARAAQAPAEKRPPDAEQLQKAIDEQRAMMRETERSLAQMRIALTSLLAQQEQIKARLSSNAAAAQQTDQQRLAEEYRRMQEQARVANLQALTAEQESTRAALQKLAQELEQLRRQFEAASTVKPQ
jgi:beta-lactamase regulating signal transducer with metallopeptidase domain